MFDRNTLNIKKSDIDYLADTLLKKFSDLQDENRELAKPFEYRSENSIKDVIHNLSIDYGSKLEIKQVSPLRYDLVFDDKKYKLQLPSFIEAVSMLDSMSKQALSDKLLKSHIFTDKNKRIPKDYWDADFSHSANILYIIRKLLCLQ